MESLRNTQRESFTSGTMIDMPTGSKPTPRAITQEIAAILREKQGRERLSQRKIADASGLSQSQVSKYLAAKKSMTLEELEAVCAALGLAWDGVLNDALAAIASRPSDS